VPLFLERVPRPAPLVPAISLNGAASLGLYLS
jgi:hypothetical protein